MKPLVVDDGKDVTDVIPVSFDRDDAPRKASERNAEIAGTGIEVGDPRIRIDLGQRQ